MPTSASNHGIQSYIAVPLNRRDGTYFGTLFAASSRPFAGIGLAVFADI
jgi:hypothetical protein